MLDKITKNYLVDTIDKIIKYIEDHPTANNSNIIMMLMDEKEIAYVKEPTAEIH